MTDAGFALDKTSIPDPSFASDPRYGLSIWVAVSKKEDFKVEGFGGWVRFKRDPRLKNILLTNARTFLRGINGVKFYIENSFSCRLNAFL